MEPLGVNWNQKQRLNAATTPGAVGCMRVSLSGRDSAGGCVTRKEQFMRHFYLLIIVIIFFSQVDAPPAYPQSEGELAKKLQNPVANLISVPLQSNWDFGSGSTNAMRYTLNLQPVIPFSLTNDWNLITRTIVPIIHAEAQSKGGRDKSGLLAKQYRRSSAVAARDSAASVDP